MLTPEHREPVASPATTEPAKPGVCPGCGSYHLESPPCVPVLPDAPDELDPSNEWPLERHVHMAICTLDQDHDGPCSPDAPKDDYAGLLAAHITHAIEAVVLPSDFSRMVAAIESFRVRVSTPVEASKDGRVYPCDKCGVMRSRSEGGTVFTVCDECWDQVSTPAPDAPKYQEITCGAWHPDAALNARARSAAEQMEGSAGDEGCGRSMAWIAAYRCVECGRFFHARCMQDHFARHTFGQPEVGVSTPATDATHGPFCATTCGCGLGNGPAPDAGTRVRTARTSSSEKNT